METTCSAYGPKEMHIQFLFEDQGDKTIWEAWAYVAGW
jgi:hypothetical protein